MLKPEKKFMELAIKEAQKARRAGDYAVGAVLVRGNQVVARGGNRTKRDDDPIAHGEILAIKKASRMLGRRHLNDCILYTTHEPCPMCAGAVVFAHIKGVVCGARYQDMRAYRKKYANNKYSWRNVDMSCQQIFKKSTERIEVVKDFMRKECIALFHNDI